MRRRGMRAIKNLLIGVCLVLLAIFIEFSQREKDMKNKALVWWGILMLAIITLALFTQSLGSQVAIIRAPLGNYGAITTCDQANNIVVVINQSVSFLDLPQVMEHEFVHVTEMRLYQGGCQGFLNHFRADKDFRFQAEARAYCKGYVRMVAGGMPKELILKLAEYMQKLYATDKSVEDVQKALPCGQDAIAVKDGTFTIPP